MQKKVTLSLDTKLVEEVQRLVREGRAKSQSEFVGQALQARLKEIKKQRRRQRLLEASQDPVFLAEIEQLEHEFASADAEAARMIQ